MCASARLGQPSALHAAEAAGLERQPVFVLGLVRESSVAAVVTAEAAVEEARRFGAQVLEPRR